MFYVFQFHLMKLFSFFSLCARLRWLLACQYLSGNHMLCHIVLYYCSVFIMFVIWWKLVYMFVRPGRLCVWHAFVCHHQILSYANSSHHGLHFCQRMATTSLLLNGIAAADQLCSVHGGPLKNLPTNFCQHHCQLWSNFKKSSTVTLCQKFARKCLLNIPPHLNCTILACEI